MKILILYLIGLTLATESPINSFMMPPSHESFKNFLNSKVYDRIVGGIESEPHSRPYQVALFLSWGNSSAFCGGSLISKNHILTAAHCVFDGKNLITNWTVVLGAHNIFDENNGVRIQSTKAIMHPGWNPLNLHNDIAIILLPTEAPLSENIQIIELPPFHAIENDFSDAEAIISGWGKSADNASESLSDVLREVNVTVLNNIECNTTYLGIIELSQVCTSGKNGIGPCNGDSGGPLITMYEGRRIQIGIASHNVALGCEKNWPQLYARVSSFLFWINYITGIEIRP